VLKMAGLMPADIYFKNGDKKPLDRTKPPPKADIDVNAPTKIYSYQDEEGKELYQNCRYESDRYGNRLAKKTFIQRIKRGDKFVYSLDDIRRVPYNFPALLQETSVIYDTEGEKDAETMINIGLTATSTVKESFPEIPRYCKDKLIIVCEDNDKPGREKAAEKADAYWIAGAVVKILSFRDMPEKSDVTDWITADPTNNDVFSLSQIVLDLPEYSPLDPLRVSLGEEKRKQTTVLEIDGRRALPSGCIGGLTAGIGQGKSHFLQIIAAKAVNSAVEPESQIIVNLEPTEKIAIIDTEQTRDDCIDILRRMVARCGDAPEFFTPDGLYFRQVDVITMSALDFPSRREKLMLTLKRPDIKLILLDGLLDFVQNPNDSAECSNFVLWLYTMANQYDKAIFCTIHGNRGDNSGKGKGWIGDVFQRKATCFLMLRKHKTYPEIRVITTDFDNAKMRHGKDTNLNIAMQWNDDIHGFACVPYPNEDNDKWSPEYILLTCFEQAGKEKMQRKELTDWYVTIGKVGQSTAYKHIKKAISDGILNYEEIAGIYLYSLSEEVSKI